MKDMVADFVVANLRISWSFCDFSVVGIEKGMLVCMLQVWFVLVDFLWFF